jgi:hypothetical protein
MAPQSSTHVSSSLPAAETEEEFEEELPLDEADAAELERIAQDEGYTSAEHKDTAETAARLQGWRPLGEYRGKPGGWVDAKTFIQRGQDYLPFVQKENRELKQTMGNMTTEMEGLRTLVASTQSDMKKLLDFSRRANQSGYDRAMADLKAQQRQAVTDGDVAKFDQIEGQITEMDAARDEAPPVGDPPPARQEITPRQTIDPAVEAFVAENPWFNTDRVLNSAMIGEHNIIIAESPALPVAQQLEKAKEAVMRRYPKKFGIDDEPPAGDAPPPRRPAAALPPSNRRPVPPAQRAGLDSIQDPRDRAEARKGYEQIRRSMPDITEAEYLDIYNNPHGDVLDTVRQSKVRNKPNGR